MRLPFRISGSKPDTVEKHRKSGLTACPLDSQNCVSSLNVDKDHRIEGLRFTGPMNLAKERLKKIVLTLPNSKFSGEETNYLWFECESEFFGFIDDLEFQFIENAGVVQVRSQARVGVRDFAVNRKRIEQIRKLWESS